MLKIEKIGTLNGEVTYYISCNEAIQSKNKIYTKIVGQNNEELFCFDTNVEGIYSFGCKQLSATMVYEDGHIWSSNAECINGEFGTQLVDAIINGVGYLSIDINVLKPLVEQFTGKKYKIDKYYYSYDKNKSKPSYRLVEDLRK